MTLSHDSETPACGQQVITACAFIYHQFNNATKLFVAKRAETKKFLPGVYELPGGHIEFGENIKAGLKREIKEEFEVGVEVGEPFFVFDYLNEIKKSHSVEIIYFATLKGSPESIVLHPEDHSAMRWVTKEELTDLCNSSKKADDPEMQAMRRGFELLEDRKI